MHVTGLECLRCHARYPAEPRAYLCPRCGVGTFGEDPGVLDVQYAYPAAGAALAAARPAGDGMFAFLPLLPIDVPAAALPVGGTPLVAAPRLAQRFGLAALYVKDETRNPTRCLKDRASAIAVSMAIAMGYTDLYCASAGNAAISLAGFCAHLGLGCHVFVPQRASEARLRWLRRFGADVTVVPGDYDAAYAQAEAQGARHGWYSRNCAFNPYLVEGKKTAALEIGTQLGGAHADVVAAPVGDGCTLGALGKGFRELVAVGRADGVPRLLGVQSAAYPAVARRLSGSAEPPAQARTEAASIAVGRPRNMLRVTSEVRSSGGTVLDVSDAQIGRAQELLSAEAGIVAEFTGAAGMAGIARLAEEGGLAGQTAVVVVTGGRADD